MSYAGSDYSASSVHYLFYSSNASANVNTRSLFAIPAHCPIPKFKTTGDAYDTRVSDIPLSPDWNTRNTSAAPYATLLQLMWRSPSAVPSKILGTWSWNVRLFSTNDTDAVHFRKHIMQLNQALTFTSVSATRDSRLSRSEAVLTYSIEGTNRHFSGPLRGESPSYAGLYMIDPNTADDIRSNMNPNLQTAGRRVMSKISRWVEANNDFVPLFRRARIALEESRLPQLRLNAQLRLIPNPQGGRQYDLPVSTHEIGAFLPESNRLRYIDAEWSRESGRDICLYLHERPDSRIDADFPRISDLVHEVDEVLGIDGRPQYLALIHQSHPLYLPLHYVLFWPEGGVGHHRALRLRNTTQSGARRVRDKITPQMWARFLLYTRSNSFNIVHRGGALFQQFLVDLYLMVEKGRLEFYSAPRNQKKFRAEQYTKIIQYRRNAMEQGIPAKDLGRPNGRKITHTPFTNAVKGSVTQ
ncbi:ATP-dependent DNA helicase pif1 [Penicillium digitatum]|uniref:ATP-dependent DNA helicase pif1 n=1 Tax=Penicillium digitatum TaxID=36651 RepID=A0A7T6XMM9_PENDI|nr:ATP-dependent DNA helicase pif1 [Penicillium digitatum]